MPLDPEKYKKLALDPDKYKTLASSPEIPANITLPDGSIVSSLYRGGERPDTRLFNAPELIENYIDPVRNKITNYASQYPGLIGRGIAMGGSLATEPARALLEFGSEPEVVLGGAGLIKPKALPANVKIKPKGTPGIKTQPKRPLEKMVEDIETKGVKQPEIKPLLEDKTVPANPVAAQLEVERAAINETPRFFLPKDLQGAKPTYSIGTRKFIPQFHDDVDKALYIIQQKNPSKRNADYVAWLKKYTGLNDTELMTAATNMKQKMAIYLRELPNEGKVEVPQFHNLKLTKPESGRTLNMGVGKIETTPTASIVKSKEPEVLIATEAPTVTPQISAQMPTVTNPVNAPKKPGYIRQALAEARGLQTAFDVSFPFRQGVSNITRKEFWESFKPMFKAGWDETNFKKLQADIANSPYKNIMDAAGLDLTDIGKNIRKREESMRGTYLESFFPSKNPIRMSNRAYTAFGNNLRWKGFERMAKDAEAAGIGLATVNRRGRLIATPEAKAIAKFMNDSTGRGHLGRFEKIAPELNDYLFSPKLIGARVNMFRRAFQDPTIIGKNVDPRVAKTLRMEAIRSMGGIGGLAAMSIAISKFNGAKGTEDFRSTDFGKLKKGPTRLDFTGGHQQYVRTAVQIASGQVNQEGKIEDRNRLDTAWRFARNKLSPAASLIVDWMAGENVIGEEFTWDKAARDRLIPLIIQDMWEVHKTDPELFPWIGIAPAFGVGIQSYGRRTNTTGMPTMPNMPQVNLP